MIPVDILIIGGGPVGITLASSLSRLPLKIALVDQMNPSVVLDDRYDGRTMAIAYGSRLFLEGLGIWEGLAPYAQPIHEIRVSNGGAQGFVHYDPKDVKDHPMGYMVENRYLRQVLYTHQKGLKGVVFYVPSALKTLSWEPHHITARLSTGETIKAKLCLGADGASSKVREKADLKTYEWSYNQTVMTFMVQGSKPHQGRAFEHFLPQGPLAFLPVKENFCAVVWTVPTEAAAYFLTLKEADFMDDLQDRFGDTLGKLTLKSERWSYPLKGCVLKNSVASRLALVGDAAHVIHPVAGQGFNLGLRDIRVLSDVLKEGIELGLEVGDGSLLKKYEEKRRFDVWSMTAVNDGLVRLFSNDSRSLRTLRGVGLDLVEKISPLKKLLTRHAMGLTYLQTSS